MPRRKLFAKRVKIPDSKYNDQLVGKFISIIMKDGKKSRAESILYGVFDIIKEKTKDDPLKVFKKAVQNVKPKLEVKSRRVGGATFQIPVEVRSDRQIALSIKWILQSAYSRKDYGMKNRLAAELLDAADKTGGAIKKKADTHKMAEANRAFAHYRW